MKKRWMACCFALLLAFSPLYASLGENYSARNVFFDEDIIYYVAGAEDKLYVLFDSGLARMEADGSFVSLGPVPCEGWLSAFASDGETLYALDQTQEGWRVICLPVAGGVLGAVSVLPLALPADAWVHQARAADGVLWLLYSAGAEDLLSAWPLDGGGEQSWPVQNVEDFDLMGDGGVLVLRREPSMTGTTYSLRAFDPATAGEEDWASWTEDAGTCLAYDPYRQTAYLVGRETMYTVQAQGQPVYLDGFLGGDVMSVALLDTGAALVVDGMLAVRDFTQRPALTLRILCDHGRGEQYRAFVEANPQIDLQFLSPTLGNCEEQFMQDMLLGESSADVYVLEELSLLASLKEKGYFADLRQDAELSALAEQMYPAFRSLFCAGDAVAAFPKDVFLEVLCYHKPTFAALGMEPPATYGEYFDFCLNWLEELGEAYPDLSLRPFTDGLDLETLLIRYANAQMRQGGEPTFATPELAALVEQYFALEKAYEQAGTSGKTALFASYTLPLWGEEDAYGYLPLSFGVEATLTPAEGDVSYFVVNPYGQHPLEAMALVASYGDWRAEVGQALLFSSVDQPIERKLFADEYAAMEKKLAELEESLAQADPADRRDLEMQIDEQRAKMAALQEEDRWAVSLEALETYRELSNLVWLNPENAVPQLWDELPQPNADASAQEILSFLETLDQRWRMLRLESGAGVSP